MERSVFSTPIKKCTLRQFGMITVTREVSLHHRVNGVMPHFFQYEFFI